MLFHAHDSSPMQMENRYMDITGPVFLPSYGDFRAESHPELFQAIMRKLNEPSSLLMKSNEHN